MGESTGFILLRVKAGFFVALHGSREKSCMLVRSLQISHWSRHTTHRLFSLGSFYGHISQLRFVKRKGTFGCSNSRVLLVICLHWDAITELSVEPEAFISWCQSIQLLNYFIIHFQPTFFAKITGIGCSLYVCVRLWKSLGQLGQESMVTYVHMYKKFAYDSSPMYSPHRYDDTKKHVRVQKMSKEKRESIKYANKNKPNTNT